MAHAPPVVLSVVWDEPTLPTVEELRILDYLGATARIALGRLRQRVRQVRHHTAWLQALAHTLPDGAPTRSPTPSGGADPSLRDFVCRALAATTPPPGQVGLWVRVGPVRDGPDAPATAGDWCAAPGSLGPVPPAAVRHLPPGKPRPASTADGPRTHHGLRRLLDGPGTPGELVAVFDSADAAQAAEVVLGGLAATLQLGTQVIGWALDARLLHGTAPDPDAPEDTPRNALARLVARLAHRLGTPAPRWSSVSPRGAAGGWPRSSPPPRAPGPPGPSHTCPRLRTAPCPPLPRPSPSTGPKAPGPSPCPCPPRAVLPGSSC